MIIPTLVLVTAMQFGDPQSGAKIDDLSLSPWRDVPVVKQVSYTAQTTDSQAEPRIDAMPDTITPQFDTAPATFGLGVPDPDLADGGAIGTANGGMTIPGTSVTDTVPTPLSNFGSQAYTPPTTSQNYGGNGSSYGQGYSSQTPRSESYSGATRLGDGKVYISRAKVEFDKIARLSAPVGGIVQELKTIKCDAQGNVMRGSNGEPIKIDLNRGVLLFTGQQVAQLDDRYPKAQYEVAVTKLRVAEKEATKDVEVRYAKSSWDVSERELQRKIEVNQNTPRAVPQSEIDIAKLSVIQASLQHEKAVTDHETKQDSVLVQREEVRVAETQLDLRKIKTPFNAMVINVITQVGNYLKEGDPLAEVAQLDKLKVLANVDGNLITQEKVNGKRVTVTAMYDGQKEEFDGFVRYAAPSFNTLRQFEIEIEIDNRLIGDTWRLRQGDYVDVVIHLN